MIFYALASTVNINENEKIQNIWNELDFACDVNQVKFAPIPHFSYMTYKNVLDQDALIHSLDIISRKIEPFQIQVSGLGIFQGQSPILYLPLVKTKLLSTIHSEIISGTADFITETSEFYYEENWIPHITLAIRDITSENLSCAVDQCMQFDLSFRLSIDHLAILYMDEESFGVKNNFAFKTSIISAEESDESLGSYPS